MITVEVYRARIGAHLPGSRVKKRAMRGLKVQRETISLALKVLTFALLVVAMDVEANPGPTFTAEKDSLLNGLKDKYEALEAKFMNMHREMTELIGDNKRLKERCVELETRCENSESQSRRDNLLFHQLPSSGDGPETWEQSENIVRTHLRGMDLDDDIQLERCHRLNPRNKDSPIIVKFSHHKDRCRVLERERERKKRKKSESQGNQNQQRLDGRTTRQTRPTGGNEPAGSSEPHITEDFTARVRRVRAFLRPFMDECFRKKQKVRLSYDKLIVDGKTYWYDETAKSLVDKKPAVLSCLSNE